MKPDLLNDIIRLIEHKMGKYKKSILRTTTLENDLGITGDDAVELLQEFSIKFKVDISKFEFGKYFYPEGDTIFPDIFRFFTGSANPKQTELSLGDLEKAAIAGKLDEEVIGRQN